MTLRRGCPAWKRRRFSQSKATMRPCTPSPVSYTHLDVYKRQMLAQYKGVFLSMLRNPATMTIMAIMVLINITTMLTSNFFGLYITQDLGVAEPLVALFPIARAIVMLAFLFTVQAAINRLPFKKPMLWGLALYVVSMALLLLAPASHGLSLIHI